MNKKPLILRTLITLVVVLVFAAAMYPLTERDYYDVFRSMLKNPDDPVAAELIAEAKRLENADPNNKLFQSQALLDAADNKGVSLKEMVKEDGLQHNKDVISAIRKKAAGSIRLGLDLNGGVEYYLQLEADENQSPELREKMDEDFDHYREVAIETLRKRLESKGIHETEIAPHGAKGIVLRAPIVSKTEKESLRDEIRRSANLEFRLVKRNVDEHERDLFRADPEYMEYTEIENGKPVVRSYLVELTPQMTGKNIEKAAAYRDETTGQLQITLQFNADGAEEFKQVTEKNVGRQLAIVLDGELYCAPRINEAIGGGRASISGSFTEEEAKGIASALTAGSFPYKIKVDATFDTDPTLGRASVQNGIWVGIISLAIVAVFMIIYYRASGIISVLALALNVMLILGAMAAFGSTLTLPGIAGIVLTIGMAVDANVLIFERIREELKSGKSLLNAVETGYDRALTAVVDSNITTLITSFILMYVGTGAIKGFAVTLCIGILSSLFSAVFVTRLVYDYLFRFFNIKKLTMMQMVKESKFDFVKIWKYSLCFSLALLVILIGVFAVRGKGVLGIDFTGGYAITYDYKEKVNTSDMAAALRKAGFDEPSVTYKTNVAVEEGKGEKLEVRFRDAAGLSDEDAEMKVCEVLNKEFPAGQVTPDEHRAQHLGAQIGWEFSKNAIIAIVLALIGIGAYIVFRYELSYAVASVLALLHDVMAVLAIYLLCGRTIGLTTVAAFLTVIGYSINDTVVIFDRVRENLQLNKGKTMAEIVNLSVNQTLSRTLITSLTTFIVVFIMWLFGGPEISDFVFVMMWGIILGTFSSVFLSGPFVAWRAARKAAKAQGGNK